MIIQSKENYSELDSTSAGIRKTYKTPILVDYGNMHELTQGGFLDTDDGDGSGSRLSSVGGG